MKIKAENNDIENLKQKRNSMKPKTGSLKKPINLIKSRQTDGVWGGGVVRVRGEGEGE